MPLAFGNPLLLSKGVEDIGIIGGVIGRKNLRQLAKLA